MRRQGCSNLLVRPKMMKMSMGSLEVYKRLSMTTRFVHDYRALPEVYKDSRRCNKQQNTIKDAIR